jgi:hypothetical protein
LAGWDRSADGFSAAACTSSITRQARDEILLATRLRNQKLTGRGLARPEDVVAWFGAVQAQDFVGAKWAVSLRGVKLADADVEAAFAEGRILRTHVLRPTWHFVAAADIRWMLALTAPRVQALNRNYGRTLGLDDRLFTRGRQVVERALEGGRFLTRKQLSLELGKARIEARGQRLAHLLMDIEQQAVICSGPRVGVQFTYALVSERAPRATSLSREESLAELARRYFQSHGPATLRDFCWWSGLTVRDARAAVALAKVEVMAEPPALDLAKNATYLLPNYDEYLIAYRDRGAVLDPARARNLGVYTTREYPHHAVVDGRVAGSWRRTISSTALRIDVRPYARLAPNGRRALVEQAKRYGESLGLTAEVRVEQS